MHKKNNLLKSIAYSLFSPFLIGSAIGIYYTLTLDGGNSQLFFSILLSAVSNAHIVGLTMAILVVPIYLYLFKRNKLTLMPVMTAAIFGGALFSFMFNVNSGQVFVINTVMAALAAGIFLFVLKQNKNCT